MLPGGGAAGRPKRVSPGAGRIRETLFAEISLFRAIGGDGYELLKCLGLEHVHPAAVIASRKPAQRRAGAANSRARQHDARNEYTERQDPGPRPKKVPVRRGKRPK